MFKLQLIKENRMVQAAPENAPARRSRLNRFCKWENRLEVADADAQKVPDVRKNISKVDFNTTGPIRKHYDCRVLQSKVPVTQGYAQRRVKDPIFDAFGIGTEPDAIKGNATINMLHRDNVWHPYFEI